MSKQTHIERANQKYWSRLLKDTQALILNYTLLIQEPDKFMDDRLLGPVCLHRDLLRLSEQQWRRQAFTHGVCFRQDTQPEPGSCDLTTSQCINSHLDTLIRGHAQLIADLTMVRRVIDKQLQSSLDRSIQDHAGLQRACARQIYEFRQGSVESIH